MGDSKEERRQFWIKVSLVFLILFSAANVFLMLVIVPKFMQIYGEALPGMPLPEVTVFVITARVGLAVLDLGWPILGSLLMWNRNRYSILWINIGLIWTFLQVGVAIFALFIPLAGGLITGSPEINHT
jgi:hypothetical protein